MQKWNRKIEKSKKINSTILIGIYFFLVALTSFHFHPIDFAQNNKYFNTAPTEASTHFYTADECPIINFANNGFSSTFHPSDFVGALLNTINSISPNNENPFYSGFKSTLQLRAPPILAPFIA